MKRIAAQCRWLPVAMTVAVLLCAGAPAAADPAAGSTVAATAGSAADTVSNAAANPSVKPEASFMDSPEGAADTAGSAVPHVGVTLARLVGALVLIGALLLGGLVLFKRLAGRTLKFARGGTEKPLRIVEKISLGAKTHLCLLNACGRYLVIGVTEKEINVLMEVTLPGDESAPRDFAALLAGAATGGPSAAPEKRSAN
ncbi:MAG: flagellar biosynthetic protein FliO [Candidatus Brocadiia bacterium]